MRDIIFNGFARCIYADGQFGFGCQRGRTCAGGCDKIILDEPVKGYCIRNNDSFRVVDPTDADIIHIKRLIKLEQNARDAGVKPISSAAVYTFGSEPYIDLQTDHALTDFMNTKPSLEVGVAESMTGEKLNNVLGFTAWLRANKFAPAYANWNFYKINIKGQTVCNVKLGFGTVEKKWYTNQWRLAFSDRIFNNDNLSLTDSEKNIIWSNVKLCNDCGCSCRPGGSRTYCGKDFNGVCGGSVQFWNPGVEEMECAKKLLLAKRDYEARLTK